MARRGDGIYQRGSVWYLDCRINGTRHVMKLGRNIKRSVAAEIADVKRAAILRGEHGIGTKKKDLPFKEARGKFEAWISTEKRPNTVRRYKQCLVQLARVFGSKRLCEITPWTLEHYKKVRVTGTQLTDRPQDITDLEWGRRCKQALKGSPIGVNRELAVLKTLFNKCRVWGLIGAENPVCAVKLRKEPRTRLRWLSTEEEGRLLAVAPEPIRSIIVVGLHTGLRVQAEALRLRWDDCDLQRAQLTVQAQCAKNGRSRTVPLNSIVKKTLEHLRRQATGAFVFVKSDGSPYRSIRSGFQAACKKAGLSDVTPHVLRHSFASRLVMSGTDLRTLQTLGGWRTLAMVERYAHLSESHKAAAVEKLATFHDAFHNDPKLTPLAGIV
jgi:integrase